MPSESFRFTKLTYFMFIYKVLPQTIDITFLFPAEIGNLFDVITEIKERDAEDESFNKLLIN